MPEIINGIPIGDLPGIESVPDDSMLVVEFLGKAYHMPGAVLRQMIQDVLDSMGDSVDDVTEARLTAAIETVLASGKYSGVSPIVEVTKQEDETFVLHVVDAFGIKDYPIKVKVPDLSVNGSNVMVDLSGDNTNGYTVLLDGEVVTGDTLDKLVKEGANIIGIAKSDMSFQMAVGSYTIPADTIFEYGNAIVSGNTGVGGVGSAHSFEFCVRIEDHDFAVAYQNETWVGMSHPAHLTFLLNENDGDPVVLYNGEPVESSYLFFLLFQAKNQLRPVFCYQDGMKFYLEDGSGTAITPPWRTPFSLLLNAENEYYFYAEQDGYNFSLIVQGMLGYTSVAEKNTPYKTAESKADDLKAEDGTLFLLSAGEPIGSGVPIPSGGTSEAVQYVEQTLTDEQKAQARSNIGAETAGAAAALAAVRYVAQAPTDTQKAQARSNIGAEAAGAAAALPAVKYEAQTLTDAQKAQARSNIGAPDDNIFIADYETTTYAEIKAAYDAGKTCFTSYGGSPVCQLVSITDAEALFICPMSANMCLLLVFTSDGQRYSTQSHDSAVRYNEQGLTNNQKAQARSNIGAETAGAAAALPAVKYEAQTLTDAQKAQARSNIGAPDDNIFIADYEATTYAEIKAAYDAGKTCFTSYGGSPVCQLVSITDTEAWFICPMSANMCLLLVFTSDGQRYSTQSHDSAVRYNEQGLTNNQKAQARSNIGAVGYTAPANVAGTEQVTAKLYTSNGGSIAFGKEGPNSGTMIRLDQVDGTCRLRFRASATAGAMVWEQPEQGAQLYVDLGKNGVDKHRISFPAGAGTLALTSQIPSLSGYLPLSGGLMTGPLKFQAASLPGKSLQYVCGVDAFGNGGEMGWQSKADFLSGYLTTSGTAAKATADANGNNIASTYLPKSGGTMTGALNLKNSTWNLAGDDAYFGDNDTAGSFAIKGANGTTNLKMVTYNGTTSGTLSWNGSNFAFSNALNFPGGTLTGNLTVGSAKIQTNGYVIGTWLQTTAGNASSSAMQKVCVQSPDGWIYTRTLDQLRGDMGAAGAPLKVTLSGSASSGYSVDKTVSEIAAAWNAGRNVYLTDGTSIYNLSLLQGVAAASFTGIWATTLNGKSTLTVETVLVASSGKVVMYSYSA